MKAAKIGLMCFFVVMLMACGCEVEPKKPEDKVVLTSDVDEAIALMKAKDKSIQKFFDNSYGYAVVPKIFKVAILAGGAYGKGEVYEQGTMIGYCDVKQLSGGVSLGAEFYREIIFFKDNKDLEKFKQDEFTFSAQATAIAIVWGAAAKADYKDGMAVFIMTDSGVMVDASLGGQKFNFAPKYVLEKVQ
ncbi:MAG: lipid-binding SYLF domain-containing protein [Sedimentisphaerales bacterium]